MIWFVSLLFKLIDLHLRLLSRAASFFLPYDGLIHSISLLVRSGKYAVFVAVVLALVLRRLGRHNRNVNITMAGCCTNIVLEELLPFAAAILVLIGGKLRLSFDIQTISDSSWLLQNVQLLLSETPVNSCGRCRFVKFSWTLTVIVQTGLRVVHDTGLATWTQPMPALHVQILSRVLILVLLEFELGAIS